MTAKESLHKWGLRTVGSSLKGIKAATGGVPEEIDDELELCGYVEGRTDMKWAPVFERARPILLHVYAKGQPDETFVIRGPGETLARSLMRLGWYGFIHFPLREMAFRVRRDFEVRLDKRLIETPFVPTRKLVVEEPAHIPDGYVWKGDRWVINWREWAELQRVVKKA